MSTYFVDFSADTVDAYPAGWTHTWVDASNASETKVIAGGADRVFQIGGNSGADNLHTLNAVDADANRATVDVVTRFQIDELTPGTYPLAGLALRAASGTPGDGYWAGPTGGSTCRIAKLSGGTKSLVGGSGSFTFVAATWYKMRFQASGTSLKFKIWADADAEPGTWLIEATDSSFTGAGAVGVYQAGATHEPIFDFVGVGTNGDAAPTSGGSSTPVSFSGTVPTLNGTVGVAFSQSLAGYFSGTQTPFAYSVFSGTLPGWASLNASTGVISGTPNAAATTSGLVVRATDATPNTANTNSFSITIAAAAAPPTITDQPDSATVKKGQATVFSLAATGTGTLLYQWQRSTNSGGAWSDLTGETTYDYTIPPAALSGGSANDGDWFRCVVTDDNGTTNSAAAVLTVQQATLVLNAAGYEIGDGNAPASMVVDASVAWEVAVVADELPVVATLYHNASVTTNASGRLADISDDDLTYGAAYAVLARRVSDGEWLSFTLTAT